MIDEMPEMPFLSNVPISLPVLYPEWELADMQGFAFTHVAGVVVQQRESRSDWREEMQA